MVPDKTVKVLSGTFGPRVKVPATAHRELRDPTLGERRVATISPLRAGQVIFTGFARIARLGPVFVD